MTYAIIPEKNKVINPIDSSLVDLLHSITAEDKQCHVI
jgi:hypothetical protein